MAGFADLVAGAVCIQQLGDEGTFTNAGGISLNYADNMVDEAGTYATAVQALPAVGLELVTYG